MKTYQNISFAVEENIGFLTLNRPPLNVLNMEMMEEIVDVLKDICDQPGLNGLVIRGEGKAFSAGVAVEDHLGDKAEPMIHVFHKMFHLLLKVPCPTIAVVEGAALGGGCEIATFCDISIAAEEAKFGQPEINLGLFPPVSVVVFPWLTGVNKTMELLLTGKTITAQEAQACGLINQVKNRDELEGELEELLANLRSKSPLALQVTRQAVREAMATTFAASLGKVEQIYLNDLIDTEDAQEGLHSFLEKRKPQWKNA
ncbi:enoyl-CoA hydratase/isomerase family protein [Desertibacillus haloalkaliphilus]|uniref:enoyl-CoA hydratase/isomerase family protein n=1 Tax=Desertibacillus haloalkaliphilus TaxID=1328930 RepID=UPI001C27E97E|nr:enoyl-CoA hydratase/isomerase family protein [Desertibacillus haloalkaliphilus]MBU8908216.1 enoyl-CoA hydratase/isomerase family protein [Desertibacillus haloalkaliphilus]